MPVKNERIEAIKEKARQEERAYKPRTLKYSVYNAKTRKMEIRERVIKTGKEGNSFRRMAVIMSLIAAEMGFLTFLYVIFIQAFLWFLFIPYGIGIVFACRVAVSGKNYDSKIAWIMFLLILAPVASVVYLVAGEMTASPLKSIKIKRINERTRLLEKAEIPRNLPARVRQDCMYIQNTSDYIPHYGGGAEYFPAGEDFFEDVLQKLEEAKKFIFMDFFILKEGHLANALFEILIERAKAGVDVRIITDGLGSHGTLSLLKVRKMRKYGIKITAFEPVLPVISFFMNYRNHRKIIIIDGMTGYVGGTNIADEYINAKSRFGVWKDASMRIDGGAVRSLTLTFLRMWQYSSRGNADYELLKAANERPERGSPEGGEEPRAVIIPYADGPSEKHKLGKGVYANIISGAQKTLYIMTPYFIIDDYITDMLKAKAQSGVDVRLVIPGTPDKKTVYALTRYNAERLVPSGVRIYAYTPGFLHSKVMFSDDECAVVGSINMDFRSFYQQYESAAYIAGTEALKAVAADFEETFAVSKEIKAADIKKRNIFARTWLGFLRLFSPLM